MNNPASDSPDALVTDPDWRARILRELDDRDPREALAWRVPDGFDVPAARGPQDVSPPRTPIPMRAGGVAWTVREDVTPGTDLSLSTEFGAGSVGLVLRDERNIDLERIAGTMAGEPLIRHVLAGSGGTGLVDHLARAGVLPPGGTLDLDTAMEAVVDRDASWLYDWTAGVLPAVLPVDFRPACADGLEAHRRGATDTTELAVITASTASWFRALVSDRGVAPDQAAASIHVTASAGPLFFPTIARLRALRLLLFRVAGSFGVSDEATRRIPVHTRTSPRIHSAFDAWTNLLRATTAGTAAVIGGCDSLSVTPHDEHTERSDRGRRLALSLQALLREEGRLHLVEDPACGSWYVESLTERMAEAAWRRFQEMELQGGLDTAAGAGALAKVFRDEAREQEEAFDRRKLVMIGVNRYAEPSEPPPPPGKAHDALRPSARLEALRSAMHPEKTHGHLHAPALLVSFGVRRDCGPRSSFATDFLGCAGIRLEGPVRVETEEAMTAVVSESESPLIVLCGSEEAFERFGAAARRGLEGRRRAATLVGVGRPPDGEPESWFMDSCIDESKALVAGLGQILSAAGLRFEAER